MSEPMAIKAAFVNVKSVPSRNAMQLIFEVPLEGADAALHGLGGFPLPGSSRWCGIAVLNNVPDKPTQGA